MAMHVLLTGNKAQRAQITETDRPSWVYHETYYGYWMVALCLRLCWAREKWFRSLFRHLCMQFQVDTAVAWAEKLRICMDCDDSMIYIGFQLSIEASRCSSDLIMAWLRTAHHTNDGWSTGGQSNSTRQGCRRDERRSMPTWLQMEKSANGSSYPTSRFWVEKGGRKHRENIFFFLAESYGPGLKP